MRPGGRDRIPARAHRMHQGSVAWRHERTRALQRRIPSCEILEDRQLLAVAVTTSPEAEVHRFDRVVPRLKAPLLFTEPMAGRTEILDAIASARHRIRLGICSFTDTIIGDALIAAARHGVQVRSSSTGPITPSTPAEQALMARLMSAGVAVHLSNPIFLQSYEKELVIDRRHVLIMTMCLEPATFTDTRDYGLVLASPEIIGEVTNSSTTTGITPRPRAIRYRRSTRRLRCATRPDLEPDRCEFELDGADPEGPPHDRRHDRIARRPLPRERADRGGQSRGEGPPYPPAGPARWSSNLAGIALLAQHGVQVHVTIGQYPPANAMPYMHAKTMIVNGRLAYLGSIDLETLRDERGPRARHPVPAAPPGRPTPAPVPVRLVGDVTVPSSV